MSQVFAVKIILQDKASPVAENTDIGLYNVASDNSEFRWTQNAISGVTTWKDGMIVEKGIKPFSIGIDLKRGGAASLPGSGSVIVKNNLKLWQTIEALGITLLGLRAELYIFNDTTPIKLRTYSCGEPTWDGFNYTIPFKGRQEASIAQMLNVVSSYQFPKASKDTIGKTIPMTIGKLYPVFNSAGKMIHSSMAKFIRVEDNLDEDSFSNANFTFPVQGENIHTFPVFNIVDDTTYRMEFYGDVNLFANMSTTDLYAIVQEGTGKGQIRKVTSLSFNSVVPEGWILEIKVDPVFKTELSVADDDTRSWVQLVKIARKYACDHHPCKSFLASTTGEEVVDESKELYSEADGGGLEKIAQFALEVNDTNNNEMTIQGSQYSDDIDSLDSFIILPITSLEKETAADLSNWEHPNLPSHNKILDGIYASDPAPATISFSNMDLTNPSYAYDRNSTTYAEFSPHTAVDAGTGYVKVLKFGLPAIPKDINVEGIYLGIKSYTKYPNALGFLENNSIAIMFRRFIYSKTTDRLLGNKNTRDAEMSVDGLTMDDLPDAYYIDEPSTASKNFYQESETSAAVFTRSGYTLFELSDCTREIYNTYIEGGLFFDRVMPTAVEWDDILRIYQLAIIIKLTKTTIKSSVLSPLAGRNFASTWGGRKTDSDLIEKPVDLLEHVCRLQSWQDRGNVPVSGWGLQYSDDALIATSGHGSFDSITGRDLYAAGQLLEEEEGYTDKAKQVICRNFGIANWQDSNGYERAIALPTSALAPIFTVTLDSIIDRQRIKIHEPRQTDIFAEPFVRYQKNPATGSYEKILAVKNVSAGTYSSTYIDGVQNSGEAQAIWQICHSLYLKTHQITKPPTDLTDLTWANGAGGYSIALAHLQRWIQWQSNTEIEFPLHVNDCLSWAECSPVNLVFSHQTNNVIRSALVESVELNPNTPYEAMIKAIMYS